MRELELDKAIWDLPQTLNSQRLLWFVVKFSLDRQCISSQGILMSCMASTDCVLCNIKIKCIFQTSLKTSLVYTVPCRRPCSPPYPTSWHPPHPAQTSLLDAHQRVPAPLPFLLRCVMVSYLLTSTYSAATHTQSPKWIIGTAGKYERTRSFPYWFRY